MSIKSLIAKLRRPSTATLGSLLVAGFVSGIIFWGGFNTAMEATNTETFCISCHEMEENVYQEYKDTIHYTNRTGVRATCPDCHVFQDLSSLLQSHCWSFENSVSVTVVPSSF